MSVRENIPAFAESETLTADPPAATQANGFPRGALVPIEQLNELLRRVTSQVRVVFGGFSSGGFPTAANFSYVGLAEASKWAQDGVACQVVSDQRGVAPFVDVWELTPSGSVDLWQTVYPDGGLILVGTSYTGLANYAALNLVDGSYLWGPFDLPSNTDYSGLIFFGTPEKLKLIYLADSVAYLATINRDTGVIESTVELTSFGSTMPTAFTDFAADTAQFFAIIGTTLYAYSSDGVELWDVAVWSGTSLCITQDAVFVGGPAYSTTKYMKKFSREDGTLMREYNHSLANTSVVSVAYDGLSLWFVTYNSSSGDLYLRTADLQTGELGSVSVELTHFAGLTDVRIFTDGSLLYLVKNSKWQVIDSRDGTIIKSRDSDAPFMTDGMDLYRSSGSPDYKLIRVKGPYVSRNFVGQSSDNPSHLTISNGAARLAPLGG
jgi:hypothetical protein